MKWIKTGWGNNFSNEFNEKLNFHVSFENMHKCSDTLAVVATRAIKQIQQEYPAPYYLMVSGGIDSQAMLWAWAQSGVPFIPVSVEYVSDGQIFNSHDLMQRNEALCGNIDIKYIQFDVIDFLENKLINYAQRYQCTSPQICTHMCMSESIIDGTVIYSGEFARNVFFKYTYTIFGLWRYATLSNRNVIPFFFLHDPELSAAVNVPIAEKISPDSLADNINIGEYQVYMNKAHSYKDAGIPVIPQSMKSTGFEKIKDWYDLQQSNRVTFQERMQFSNMPSKRIFDILFRYKLQKTIKYQETVVYRI